MQKNGDNILHYIKEFIMKEKRVKYLAIRNFEYGDLFNVEGIVKEFELYDIKIQNYHDLIIKHYNFINELD
jgi:hypothetical protein